MTIPNDLRTVEAHPREYFDWASLRNGGAEHGILDPTGTAPVRREAILPPPGAELVEVRMGFADEVVEAEAARRERKASAAASDLTRSPAPSLGPLAPPASCWGASPAPCGADRPPPPAPPWTSPGQLR